MARVNEKAYFTILRRFMYDDLWLEEPFSRGQAWVDLIARARYFDGTVILDRYAPVQLARGELIWSQKQMEERWQWGRTKVRNFLDWLEDSKMIERENRQILRKKTGNHTTNHSSDHTSNQSDEPEATNHKKPRMTRCTLIRIVNYNQYQPKQPTRKKVSKPEIKPDPEPQNQTGKDNGENEKGSMSGELVFFSQSLIQTNPDLDPAAWCETYELWLEYREKIGRPLEESDIEYDLRMMAKYWTVDGVDGEKSRAAIEEAMREAMYGDWKKWFWEEALEKFVKKTGRDRYESRPVAEDTTSLPIIRVDRRKPDGKPAPTTT